jgi:peptide/nickel transport system ATP-binding protein
MTTSSVKIKLLVLNLQAYYFTEKGIIRAVDDISFSINERESLGIAGESGCGKSTLSAAILRTMQAPGRIIEGSRIILNGVDIARLSNEDFNKKIRWKKVAMVFQGAMNSLDPVYTIGDQMKEIMRQHQFKGNIEVKISEYLKQVGLDQSVAKRYPHELSGGMKQRVIIAMALLLEPDVVIADEPTTALDVLVQAQIINLLKRLKKERGMTIILITHDMAIISEIADKVAIMYAGQLVEFGSAVEVYRNPKHPYSQALISAIPKLRSDNKKLQFIKGNPPNMLNLPLGCRFYARCPYAMNICKQDPPKIKTRTGYTLCWLYKES